MPDTQVKSMQNQRKELFKYISTHTHGETQRGTETETHTQREQPSPHPCNSTDELHQMAHASQSQKPWPTIKDTHVGPPLDRDWYGDGMGTQEDLGVFR